MAKKTKENTTVIENAPDTASGTVILEIDKESVRTKIINKLLEVAKKSNNSSVVTSYNEVINVIRSVNLDD